MEIDLYDAKGKHKVAGYTPEERNSFMQFLEKSMWIDTFRFLNPQKVQYTYWSARFGHKASNLGWRIDYFLVSPQLIKDYSLKVTDSLIHDQVLGSDHCPIELKLDLQPEIPTEKQYDEIPAEIV